MINDTKFLKRKKITHDWENKKFPFFSIWSRETEVKQKFKFYRHTHRFFQNIFRKDYFSQIPCVSDKNWE